MKGLLLIATFLSAASAAVGDTRQDEVAKRLRDFESMDAKVRAAAAEEVGKIAAVKASYGKPALEPMLKLLKDKEPAVRAAAAEALGKLDEPKKTVPALHALLKSEKEDAVKLGVAVGLAVIGEPARETLPTLRETAQKARADKNNRLAMACRTAIESIGAARKK